MIYMGSVWHTRAIYPEYGGLGNESRIENYLIHSQVLCQMSYRHHERADCITRVSAFQAVSCVLACRQTAATLMSELDM